MILWIYSKVGALVSVYVHPFGDFVYFHICDDNVSICRKVLSGLAYAVINNMTFNTTCSDLVLTVDCSFLNLLQFKFLPLSNHLDSKNNQPISGRTTLDLCIHRHDYTI
jgi:hypothetical protein